MVGQLSPDSGDEQSYSLGWTYDCAMNMMDCMTSNSSYHIDDLLFVLESALQIMAQQVESKDAVEAARFLSNYLTVCVGQYLIHPKQLPRLGQDVGPETLVHAIMALMTLTASVQHWWISALDEGQDPMPLLDGNLLHLLQACLQSLAMLMDYQCPVYNTWKPMLQKFADDYGVLMQGLWPRWLQLVTQVPNIKQDRVESVFLLDDDSLPDLGIEMLHHLYDTCSGAELCKQSLVHIHKQHLCVVESTLRLVAKVRCLELLSDENEAQSFWYQDLVGLKRSLLASLREDPEQLNPDRERTYNTLSAVLVHLFDVWKNLINDGDLDDPTTCPKAIIQADAEVREVQRALVEELLRSSNFNKLLSAVRECHLMMQRAREVGDVDGGQSLQENVAWMDSNDVLRKMLRANLHQRQYAELVLKILQVLNESGLLRDEHLDILWSATEAEGTFDVVKSNVFTMIEELAGNLSQDHFEQLFRKFEGLVKARSLGDSLRLLDLLKKLASSDVAQSPNANHVPGQRAEKLLDMVWQLTMPADAPPELLEADAMTEVLRQYEDDQPGPHRHLQTYLHRCIEQLRAKQGVYTALHVLCSLLQLCEDLLGSMKLVVGKEQMSGTQKLLGDLDKHFGLQQLLVDNLCDFMAAAQRWLAEPVEVGGGGGATHRLNGGSEVLGSMRLPGQGCYTYSAIVHEYLKAILHIAEGSFSFYPTSLAQQLWDALVLQPAHPSDVGQGLNFMRQGAAESGFFDTDTMKALLVHRITALPASSLEAEAWEVYQDYFIKVNEDTGYLEQGNTENGPVFAVQHLDQLEGVPFLWHVAMDCGNSQVVTQAMQLLLHVYVLGAGHALPELVAQSTGATHTFIRECSQRLLQSAAVLAGHAPLPHSGSTAAHAGRREAPPDADLTWLQHAAQEASRAALQAGPVRTAQASARVPAAELEQASRRVQRCLQLMAMAVEAGQSPILPPVPSHRASFKGQPVVLEVQWAAASTPPQAALHPATASTQQPPQQHRQRMAASSTDYVGVVRQRVGQLTGMPAGYLRLLCGGQEWRDDAALLSSVVPRAALAASVTGRAPTIMVAMRGGGGGTPPELQAGWPETWRGTPMGLLASQPSLYNVLLFLADHPHSREVRQEAVHMLQLLPTCTWIPSSLAEALAAPTTAEAHTLLKRLLLLDRGGAAAVPAHTGAGAAEPLASDTSMQLDVPAQHASAAIAPLPSSSSSSAFDIGPTPSAQGLPCPAKLLYILQALHALMFPAAWPAQLAALQPQPVGVASEEAREGPQPQASQLRARNIRNVCGCLPLLMEVAQRAVMEHPRPARTPGPLPLPLPAIAPLQPPPAAAVGQPARRVSQRGPAAGQQQQLQQLLQDEEEDEEEEDGGLPEFPAPCWASDGGAGYLTELHSAITHLLFNIVQDVTEHQQLQEQQHQGQGHHKVVGTSGGGLEFSAVGQGPEGMDEMVARQLGTPTGMLRALSVATPTPDCSARHDNSSVIAAAAAATAAITGSGGGEAAAEDMDVEQSDNPAAPARGSGREADGVPRMGLPPHADGGSGAHTKQTDAVCPLPDKAAADDPAAGAAPVVLVLDSPTLQAMTALLLRICWDASRLTLAPTPPAMPAGVSSTASQQQQQQQQQQQLEGGGGSECGARAVLAGACSSSSGGGSGEAWLQDAVVGVVREGLGLLGKLLQHHPPLFDVLFSKPRAGQLLAEALLHATNPVLRTAAAEQLQLLCLGPQAPASGVLWLFKKLYRLRGVVPVAFASVCGEYYKLFFQVVSCLPDLAHKGQPEVELCAFQLADRLLQQEAEALKDVDSCCMPTSGGNCGSGGPKPALTTTLTGASLPALGSSSADGSVSGHGARQDVLRGRLEVVQALVQALDRSGEGSNAYQDLVRLLLRSYLFPQTGMLALLREVERTNQGVERASQEAAHPAAAEGAAPPPAALSPPAAAVQVPNHMALRRALDVCACDPAARQAAFNLVAELMSGCGPNFGAGFEALSKLHFLEGMGPLPKQPAKAGAGGTSLEPLRPAHGYVGLRNGGATCYMNSVLQQLFMQPRIRKLVLECVPAPPEEAAGSVFAQLQAMFAHLALGRAAAFNPSGFWDSFRDYDGEPIDIREHQDAYEFFTRLQDGVDAHMRSVGSPLAMSTVLGGTFAQQVICREGPYRSERDDEFLQISVDVKGKGSLEKSLESYVQGELMEGENAWLCEEVGRRMAATKRTCIKHLPQTLAIHLKRFEYDHINMQRFKVRDRFEFPVTLDMYKYTAEGLAAMEGSSAQALLQGNSSAAAGAAGASASAAPGGLLPPRSTYLYELSGVVVHSGSAFAGHYYSYIKERPCVQGQEDAGVAPHVAEGGWFRFDDRCVEPWDPSALEAECFGGGVSENAERPNSAYMLFYDRKDATCVETDPVQWAVNPVQALELQESMWAQGQQGTPAPRPQLQRHGADVQPEAVNHGGTAAGGRSLGSGGPDLAATPYGMPARLYQEVLNSNLQLAHRAYAFDKAYAGFVRNVAEARHERAAGDVQASGRKTRRTTQLHEPMLPALSPSPPHQQQQQQGGAEQQEGAGGRTPPQQQQQQQQQQLQAQGPSSHRVQDMADAAAQAAQMAAAFIGNVLLHAPNVIRHPELAAWEDLLASLLPSSHAALCTFVRGLLQPGLCDTVMAYLLGFGNLRPVPWLLAQLRRMQAQLIAACNQVLPRDLPDGTGLELNLATEPMATLHHLVHWVWRQVTYQYTLHYQAKVALTQARARNRVLPNTSFAWWHLANPMPQTAPLFLLLADAIALDAPVLMAVKSWLQILTNCAFIMSECLLEGYRDTCEEEVTDVLTALVSALVQGLLRLPDLEVYQPVLMANNHVKPPTIDLDMGRAWAAQIAEDAELQARTRDDPGPPQLLAPYLGQDSRPLDMLRMPQQSEDSHLIPALMWSGDMVAEGSNAHMLRLLCWDNQAATRQVLDQYPKLLIRTASNVNDNMPTNDLNRKVTALGRPAMVAADLLSIPDSLRVQRLYLSVAPQQRSGGRGATLSLASLLLAKGIWHKVAGALALADALEGGAVAEVYSQPAVRDWCVECVASLAQGDECSPPQSDSPRVLTCMEAFTLMVRGFNSADMLQQLCTLQESVQDSTPRSLRPFRRLAEMVAAIMPMYMEGMQMGYAHQLQQQQQLEQGEPVPIAYVPMDNDSMSVGDLDQEADQMSAEDEGEEEVEEVENGSEGGGQTSTPPAS